MRSFWMWIVIVLTLIPIAADATAVSVTIYGTNKSNAQTNVTCYGCNNTISVQAWNTSYVKNISVNSLNASGDVVSFNISNITAFQVQELKVNKTTVNAYQAGANGMLNFSYTVLGNKTLTLQPAPNINGYNMTWGYAFGNPVVSLKRYNNLSSYGIETVYHNTYGTYRFVSTAVFNNVARCEVRSDANNPPTTVIQFNTGNAQVHAISFWVAPGDYYMISKKSGTGCSLDYGWGEWN